MITPTIDPKLVNPLIQALARQREQAMNAAAEFEARATVLEADNAALLRRIAELSAPAAVDSTPMVHALDAKA